MKNGVCVQTCDQPHFVFPVLQVGEKVQGGEGRFFKIH